MSPSEPGSGDSRDGSIDLFRWICILSVVIHHSVFPSRQSPPTVHAILFLKEMLGWCVTGFFFVSGWLSKPDTFGWPSTLSRARRLLIPFLCVNAVVCVAMLVLIRFGVFRPAEDWSFHGILLRMVWLQGLGPQFYFLPYLLVVGTLTVAGARILGRTVGSVLWGLLAVIVYLRIDLPATAFGPDFDRIPLYCAIMGLGMSLRDGHRNNMGIGLATTGLAAGAWLAWRGDGSSILHTFLPVPLFFLLRMAVRGKPMPVLSRWNSGALYLWHAPIILPAAAIFWHLSRLPEGLQLVLAITTTVVACQAIHLFFTKMGAAKYLAL